MATDTSSITVTAVVPLAERRQALRRESLRDFAGVAAGVAAGALIWIALLALARFPT
jgi:hypothetical protein